MKAIAAISVLLSASTVAAHSAVWNITFDGTTYPARDVRFDRDLQAKRIEWNFEDAQDFKWAAVLNVTDRSIACGVNAKPPELTAKARAGSQVSVQWSGIIRMHYGPAMTYLGRYEPGKSANDIEFFKINEAGYDKERKKWANEDLIENNRRDTFMLPTDIKSGIYVLRTELLALHGNARVSGTNEKPFGGAGPQFYTHCFNVEISGQANETPAGVKFPSQEAYHQNDRGIAFNVYNQTQYPWPDYQIPGPPKYQGRYGNPSGPVPQVSRQEAGEFPAEFETEYESFKRKWDRSAVEMNDMVNRISPGMREGQTPRLLGSQRPSSVPARDPNKPFDLKSTTDQIIKGFENMPDVGKWFKDHAEEAKAEPIELQALKQKGIAMGVIH